MENQAGYETAPAKGRAVGSVLARALEMIATTEHPPLPWLGVAAGACRAVALREGWALPAGVEQGQSAGIGA